MAPVGHGRVISARCAPPRVQGKGAIVEVSYIHRHQHLWDFEKPSQLLSRPYYMYPGAESYRIDLLFHGYSQKPILP